MKKKAKKVSRPAVARSDEVFVPPLEEPQTVVLSSKGEAAVEISETLPLRPEDKKIHARRPLPKIKVRPSRKAQES